MAGAGKIGRHRALVLNSKTAYVERHLTLDELSEILYAPKSDDQTTPLLYQGLVSPRGDSLSVDTGEIILGEDRATLQNEQTLDLDTSEVSLEGKKAVKFKAGADAGEYISSRCNGEFEPAAVELGPWAAHLVCGGDGSDGAGPNRAQDYNAARSNKPTSIAWNDPDSDDDGASSPEGVGRLCTTSPTTTPPSQPDHACRSAPRESHQSAAV